MAFKSRLLWGALHVYTLLSSHVAAQTTTTLPPPAAYNDGYFFKPDTEKTQLYPVGSTMTVSWDTAYKSVIEFYLVFGEDFNSPRQLRRGSGSPKRFDWIVDDYGNNTLPFSILCVDPEKSKAEGRWVGFMSGQFWIENDSEDAVASRTTSGSKPTQNVAAADAVSSSQSTLPTSESADDEDEDLTTTSRAQRTQTIQLTSTVPSEAASNTASSGATLPAVTTAPTNPAQNTTSPSPAERTIYVAQTSELTSPDASASASESASFLERHDLSKPGSSANIAAIGLGAGFGAVVLVVISVMAMWLLHRHRRGSKGEAESKDEAAKLERQGD